MGTRISRAKQRWPASAPASPRRPTPTAQPDGRRDAGALPDLQRGLHRLPGDRLARVDLTGEAIRLTRMLHASVPADAEAPACSR